MIRIVTILALAWSLHAQTGTFTLTSPAVGKDGKLPAAFTCDGERASPPLAWSNAPAGTHSFAITMHHIPPGAEDRHVYMVIYNISGSTTALSTNSRDIGLWGVNTVNRQPEYTPPCSKGPGDKVYTVTVYALSSEPDLKFPAGPVTMDMLLAAIGNTTLATSALDVTYARQGNSPGGPPAPRPRLMDQAIESLHLTGDSQQRVQTILQQYYDKQRQLREDLLRQLKSVLSPEQFARIEGAGGRP